MTIDKFSRRRGGAALFLSCFLTLSSAALGVEQTVQNDSLTGGDTGAIQAGFAAGESAAAWLTSPCDGNIVAVQVFWRSVLGGTPQTLEDSITIFNEGIFPNPGVQLGPSLLGPVMTDGVINEFRYYDENMTQPIMVPVTAGQVFVVSFKFFNDPGAQGPSVVTDIGGCPSQRNAIFAIPPNTWFNSCTLGVSGDFVIRAVIDCPQPPGACCLIDGTCLSDQSEDDCSTASGVFQGGGTTCTPDLCPEPEGACCFLPAGCVDLTLADCAIASGFWQGPATTCATFVCFPTGACCMPDGSCDDDVLDTDCIAAGGTFQGDGVLCSAVTCPQPSGACCLSNGNCLALTQADCSQIPNSSWAGMGTDCADGNMNGTADDCEVSCTPGNSNGDAEVNALDLQFFIGDLFTMPTPEEMCAGDFNGDGMLTTADIPDLVNEILIQ